MGFLGLFGFLDDLFGDRRRHLVVMGEVGLEGASPRGYRAQIGGVLENLRHRDERLDHLAVALAIHPEHAPAPRIKVADDVAHAFVGTGDVDRHDRFEQDRPRFFEGMLEAHRGGDLEGHIGGIDVVVAAVVDGDLEVDHRESSQVAFDQGIADAFLDRRNELARDYTADDTVDEFEARPALHRLDLEPAVAVLAATARLALVLSLRLGATLDGFLVGDFRRLKFNFNVKFAFELLDR